MLGHVSSLETEHKQCVIVMYMAFKVISAAKVPTFCKRDLMANAVSFLHFVDSSLTRAADIGIKNIPAWSFKMFYKKDRYICITISIKLSKTG